MALIIMGSSNDMVKFSQSEPSSEASILQLRSSRNREPIYTFSGGPGAFNGNDRRLRFTENGRESVIGSIFNTSEELQYDAKIDEILGCSSGPVARTIKSGQYLQNFLGPGFRYYTKHDSLSRLYDDKLVQVRRRYRLSEQDIHRWQLAILALSPRCEEALDAGLTSVDSLLEAHFRIRKGINYFTKHAINIAPMSSRSIGGALGLIKASFRERDYPAFEGFLLAIPPIVYGGIHMIAWRYEFATRLEMIMWKASCLDLVVSSFVFWLGSFCYYRAGPDYRRLCYAEWVVGSWFFFALLIVNIPVYMAARIFLVTESFISLRYVPIEVYATVQWSNIIPHI